MEIRPVRIETEAIKLDSLLKWAGVTETGGQSKMWIQEGRVRVNGTIERRRGRRLAPGDLVEVIGLARLRVVRDD